MRLTILTLTGTARVAKNLRLFKIAFALVRLNHVARIIVNANHSIM
jgi:hypothetical protein